VCVCRVWGVGFGGFRVSGLGFRGAGLMVNDLGLRA